MTGVSEFKSLFSPDRQTDRPNCCNPRSRMRRGLKIGFSKFAELRPKHCVLAGTSGTHSVCVCTIHPSVKLILRGVRLPELISSDVGPLFSYHHCLARIMCNLPWPD